MQDSDLANKLRALGHPVRIEILRLLAQRCDCTCCSDMAECLPLAQSTISQHLKVLHEAGIIKRQAEGTRNRYLVCDQQLDEVEQAFLSFSGGLTQRQS